MNISHKADYLAFKIFVVDNRKLFKHGNCHRFFADKKNPNGHAKVYYFIHQSNLLT